MSGTKISAALDIGTVAGTDMVPVARVGSTTAYHATITEILNAGTIAAGVSSWNTRTGAVTLTIGDISAVGGAPLASPAMTGVPTVPTASPGTSTAQAASTAFVAAATAVPQQAAGGNVGRNLLHNGLFNVQQRGAGPWTTNGSFTADRWYLVLASPDTAQITLNPATDAFRSAVGDEAFTWYFQNNFTGTATGGNDIIQRIEGVQRLSGKQVSLSFWAKASAGTPRLGINVAQHFGNGGSPSADVYTSFGATAALTANWTRYTLTGTIPSSIGKTFGTTAGTDYSQLAIIFSDGPNNFATGVGTQTGVVQLWGLQLEIGSVATPLEKLDPRMDLSNCQRFFQAGSFWLGGYGLAGNVFGYSVSLMVPMRATPTIAANFTSLTNVTGATAGPNGNSGAILSATVTATTATIIAGTFSASADL